MRAKGAQEGGCAKILIQLITEMGEILEYDFGRTRGVGTRTRTRTRGVDTRTRTRTRGIGIRTCVR